MSEIGGYEVKFAAMQMWVRMLIRTCTKTVRAASFLKNDTCGDQTSDSMK